MHTLLFGGPNSKGSDGTKDQSKVCIGSLDLRILLISTQYQRNPVLGTVSCDAKLSFLEAGRKLWKLRGVTDFYFFIIFFYSFFCRGVVVGSIRHTTTSITESQLYMTVNTFLSSQGVIKHSSTGQCLDRGSDGSQYAVMNPCDGRDAQKWLFSKYKDA